MTFDLIKHLTENSIPHSVSESGAINVPGDLDLADNENVTSLPDGLAAVGGYLDLEATYITTQPENLTVGGYLDLSLCRFAAREPNRGWLVQPELYPNHHAAK